MAQKHVFFGADCERLSIKKKQKKKLVTADKSWRRNFLTIDINLMGFIFFVKNCDDIDGVIVLEPNSGSDTSRSK